MKSRETKVEGRGREFYPPVTDFERQTSYWQLHGLTADEIKIVEGKHEPLATAAKSGFWWLTWADFFDGKHFPVGVLSDTQIHKAQSIRLRRMKSLYGLTLCALMLMPMATVAGSMYPDSDLLFRQAVDECLRSRSTSRWYRGYNRDSYRGWGYSAGYYRAVPRAEWSVRSSTRYDTYTYGGRGWGACAGRKYGPFTGLSIRPR
jgi:hypothetical protein